MNKFTDLLETIWIGVQVSAVMCLLFFFIFLVAFKPSYDACKDAGYTNWDDPYCTLVGEGGEVTFYDFDTVTEE